MTEDTQSMQGIISRSQLTKHFTKTAFHSVIQLPWVHVSGTITFTHNAVAVVADSNLYNYRELSHLVQGEIKTEAELIGLLYLHYGHQYCNS
jgi:hypothetical protein